MWWMLEWWDIYSGLLYRYSQLCNIRDLYSAVWMTLLSYIAWDQAPQWGKAKNGLKQQKKGV